MGDPERLLSSKSALDLSARELLETLREIEPPARTGVDSWASMAGKIAGGSALASGTLLHTAKWGLPKALLVKAGIALSLAGAALAVWVVWAPHSAPSAAVVASSAPQVASPAPAPSAAPADSAEQPSSVAAPVESAGAKPSARTAQQSQLDAEAALLTKARGELRQGNAQAAQNTLNRLQATFPKGILTQERDVLAIEVLNRTGQSAAAKRKARAFVAAYPASPHAAKLEPLLEGQ